MKHYIGIDPGKDGAIAIIGDNIETSLFPKIGKEYDIKSMYRMIDGMDVGMVVIEDLKSIKGVSANTNWAMCRGKTIWEVIAEVKELPYTLVHSKTWQKEMWSGVPVQKKVSKKNKSGYATDTKATSLIAVKRLFPNVDLTPTEKAKKEHDGIVDALLIAEYARRKFS